MIIKRLHRSDVSKVLSTAALGVAICALTHRADAQYSTDFSGPTFTAGSTVSDNGGWMNNDEYTGASYSPSGGNSTAADNRDIGQSDVVQTSTTYSSSANDNLALIGGFLNQNGGALPGSDTEYLSHPTNVPAGTTLFSFGVDFIVTPTGTSFQTNHDTFGFYVGNPLNAATAGFSVNFVPTSANSNTLDNVTYTSNGVASSSVGAITLGSRYRLSITGTFAANATGTFTAQIMSENNTGGIAANPNTFTVVSNKAFSGSISQISALWKLVDTTDLASATTVGPNPNGGGSSDTNTTARTGGGANTLYFDNVAFVPEPSTYALLGAGMLGLVSVARRRRAA